MLDVAAVINERMMDLGLTDLEVEAMSGYAHSTVNYIRNGKRGGTFQTVSDILEAIGLELVIHEIDDGR